MISPFTLGGRASRSASVGALRAGSTDSRLAGAAHSVRWKAARGPGASAGAGVLRGSMAERRGPPPGTLHDLGEHQIPGLRPRRIRVYVPSGKDPQRPRPVLY